MNINTIIEIIIDSLYFKTLFHQDNYELYIKNEYNYIKDNISDEFLDIFNITLGKEYELIEKLYLNNYLFNKDELLRLSNILKFIDANKLIDILIIMKNNDQKITNKYLKHDYDQIILQDNLHLTFIYYELLDPLKWLLLNDPINNIIIVNEMLDLSIKYDKLISFKYLIEIYECNNKENSILAIKNNSYKILEYLLKNDKTLNINELLLNISIQNNIEIIKLLIINGADINFNDDYILKKASLNGSFEIVELLIENGANIHAENEKALILASRYRRTKILKLLIDNGSNIHIDNDYPLRYASKDGYIEIVEILIINGANIHSEDDQALKWAANNNRLDVVKLLINYGSNINDGSFLIVPSMKGYFEIVKILIENGANIHYNNDTALKIASLYGHLKIVKLLIENGAKINNTALKWAYENKHYKVINFLEKNYI